MSVADEIQKLHDLHAAGQLTDAELAAAKAKVLNGSPLSGVWPQASVDPVARQKEENNWAMILHLSQLLGYSAAPVVGLAAPIVIWLLMKEQYPGLDAHGKNIANWILSSLLYTVIAGISLFIFIGFLLLPAVIIMGIVFPIIGGVEASRGKVWKYPLTIEFIR
ncbi:MAG: DUF4870 domain-containing protein [Planctomycetaceae bacterium]|nr:DUF4870 domain-containing protein [Planctomycetaceae bacterium]